MAANYSSLTAKQKKVYMVIESYIKTNGIPPTVREIGELVGEKTPGAVQGILNRLEQKGVIKRQLGAEGLSSSFLRMIRCTANLFSCPRSRRSARET